MSARVVAVVLAGGQASRLGGADKPGLEVGGRTLVASVARAAAAGGARRVVVVGPPRPELAAALPGGTSAEFTTEQPPGSGPVPALRAGLALVTEPWVLLLAADLPFLTGDHARELVDAARRSEAGAVLVDADGRAQWLAGCWRSATLRSALARYSGASLGGLLGPLSPVRVAAAVGQAPPWLDCDTPDDLATARTWAAARGSEEADELSGEVDRRGLR